MFLVEHQGQLMTREQIANSLWGKDVFVDVEQGINTAIRKIRMALEDDSVPRKYCRRW
jgi:DNA-binding response OmpR family regulator